jgi:hypothetical protein
MRFFLVRRIAAAVVAVARPSARARASIRARTVVARVVIDRDMVVVLASASRVGVSRLGRSPDRSRGARIHRGADATRASGVHPPRRVGRRETTTARASVASRASVVHRTGAREVNIPDDSCARATRRCA